MARTIAMGSQDFETIISKHCFYVDKTDFIREWWENMDSVTLLTRPRRFGKTLAINMPVRVSYFQDLQYGRRKNIKTCRELIL